MNNSFGREQLLYLQLASLGLVALSFMSGCTSSTALPPADAQQSDEAPEIFAVPNDSIPEFVLPQRPRDLTFLDFMGRNKLSWKIKNIPRGKDREVSELPWTPEVEEGLFHLFWQFQSRAKREWSTGHVTCDPDDPSKITELVLGVTAGNSGCMGCCDQDLNSFLTDDDLKRLEHFSDLQKLNIVWSDITGTGLSVLEPLESLEELSIRVSPITDEGIRQIGQLKQLKTLSISEHVFRSDSLKHLVHCENLETLTLTNCRLSAEAWEGLGQLKQLKSLHVDLAEQDFHTQTQGDFEVGYTFHRKVKERESSEGITKPNYSDDPEDAFLYLKHLQTMQSLEEFVYSHGFEDSKDLEDHSLQQDLKQLAKCKTLKRVVLTYREHLTPDDLWVIATESNIEEIREWVSGRGVYMLGRSQEAINQQRPSSEETLARADKLKELSVIVRDVDDFSDTVSIHGMDAIEVLYVHVSTPEKVDIAIRDMPSLQKLVVQGESSIKSLQLEDLPLLARLELAAPDSLKIENVGNDIPESLTSRIGDDAAPRPHFCFRHRTLPHLLKGAYLKCSVQGNLSNPVACELTKIKSMRSFVFIPDEGCNSEPLRILGENLSIESVTIIYRFPVEGWVKQLEAMKPSLVQLGIVRHSRRDNMDITLDQINSIRKLSNLRYLCLEGMNAPDENPIPWLDELDKLQYLLVSSNRIGELCLDELDKLQYLLVSSNRIGELCLDFEHDLKQCLINADIGELSVKNWASERKTLSFDDEWTDGFHSRTDDEPIYLNYSNGIDNITIRDLPELERIVMPRSSNMTIRGDMSKLREVYCRGPWDDGKFGTLAIDPSANVPYLETDSQKGDDE